MKHRGKWLITAAILLVLACAWYFVMSKKDTGIKEIEKLTGLYLPSNSTLEFEADNLSGHIFYVVKLSDMMTFIVENDLALKSFKNEGYIERHVQNVELLPSIDDSLFTFSSRGPDNKWLAIINYDSKLMWLSLHYIDHSGDLP